MATRMDKYREEQNQTVKSRSEKNSHLYQELYTNKVYTEFTNIENNVISLTDIDNDSKINKRENYQKKKMDFFNNETKTFNDIKENNILNNNRELLEEKNYNINDILESAKKNRRELDEEEKKRHQKTVEYNILSDLSEEKRQEQEKNQKLTKAEEENLEELIHTITSNSLRKKIDDELLSELMPSEESETIISNDLSNEISEKEIEKVENNSNTEEEEEEIDKSFYTKSMDLSEEDFDYDDEEDKSFLEDSKMSLPKKILTIVFITAIIAAIVYIIFKFV